MKNQTVRRMAVAVLALGLAGTAGAGSLTPPGAPASTMCTMSDLYQALTNVQAQLQDSQQRLASVEQRLASAGMQQTSGNMALILAGDFAMGACTNVGQESLTGEAPVHTVYVSAFYMDKTEVTSNLWTDVYTWAVSRGYTFANAGSFKAPGHPVQTVTWWDCVAWCNARSQRDGFAPCYTNSDGTVYMNSAEDFSGDCDWAASGYRLPTEAEWEKAARSGAANMRFPWGDANAIQHSRANYTSSSDYVYDTSSTLGYNPAYNDGTTPYTSPAGAFAANGYGLYDMAGNVWEWGWDWYDEAYYSSSPSADPRGPSSGDARLVLGGSWNDTAMSCRVANRTSITPAYCDTDLGFRTVRSAP